jgi:hypothetical protein
VGSDGLIQSSAINAPRFDYDPVTLALRGLLIEEQRVNLLLNSDILGSDLITQSVTVTAQSYTLSFYGTGTITLSGAAVQIVTGTGAYPSRRTLTFTPTAGVLICTVTGTVQFAQLEAGTFVTSFIPTVASTVTRAADIASMTGTNFSSWYNQSEGTFVASYINPTVAASKFPVVYAARIQSNNTSQNTNEVFLATTSSQNLVRISGVDQALIGYTGVYTPGTIRTVATTYKVNNFAVASNGTLSGTDTSGNVPTALDMLNIGFNTTSDLLNSHIRSITYYPSRLTNAQLQALTA